MSITLAGVGGRTGEYTRGFGLRWVAADGSGRSEKKEAEDGPVVSGSVRRELDMLDVSALMPIKWGWGPSHRPPCKIATCRKHKNGSSADVKHGFLCCGICVVHGLVGHPSVSFQVCMCTVADECLECTYPPRGHTGFVCWTDCYMDCSFLSYCCQSYGCI